MTIAKLAWKTLWFKPLNTVLSIILLSSAVTIISLLVLLQTGFEQKYRANLENIDFVLGAKGSPLQLILSSVYQIDTPTGNINYNEALQWMEHPHVDTAIPLALGDNFKGYKIVGTTAEYLSLHGNGLKSGKKFENKFEVVVGNKLAEEEGLKIGDEFYGAHGHNASGHVHKDHPYTVVGVATPTGKIVDHLILCNIASVWAAHDHDTETSAAKTSAENHHHEEKRENKTGSHIDEHQDHHSKSLEEEIQKSEREITSVLIKLKNKMALVTWPRLVAQNTKMQVASPIIEVKRLFSLFGIGVSMFEYLVSGIMFLSAISIFIALYTRLAQRKHEFALMRISGGNRYQLLKLIIYESLFICITGYIIGTAVCRITLYFLSNYTSKEFHLAINPFDIIWLQELLLIGVTLILGILAAIIPAIKAYNINISKTLSHE
ncbi:ABC transporter permease [Autumnicola musiva]|uniref:FtsX-like permease family protein n=1 Tax=Autumnicola musiva TaxID=3075589 RepID=A0ABU3DB01_9FLAO|nr:FtsX-like permease family protein [Zunongwangia sp. F117]MDT0678544.1 FtsX-like permease family protein [Zunongwangia sp. F117]